MYSPNPQHTFKRFYNQHRNGKYGEWALLVQLYDGSGCLCDAQMCTVCTVWKYLSTYVWIARRRHRQSAGKNGCLNTGGINTASNTHYTYRICPHTYKWLLVAPANLYVCKRRYPLFRFEKSAGNSLDGQRSTNGIHATRWSAHIRIRTHRVSALKITLWLQFEFANGVTEKRFLVLQVISLLKRKIWFHMWNLSSKCQRHKTTKSLPTGIAASLMPELLTEKSGVDPIRYTLARPQYHIIHVCVYVCRVWRYVHDVKNVLYERSI